MSDALPNNATSDNPQPTTQEDAEMTTGDEVVVNGQLGAGTNGIQAPVVDEEMTDQQPGRLELQEARIPTKKDATLREFLSKMDDCAPIIPDAVTNYYLTLAGLPPPPITPLPLARLLALATQKFIADIAADAYQYSRIRASNTSSNAIIPGVPSVGAVAGGPAQGAAKETAAEKADKGKGAGLGGPRPGFGGGGQGGSQGRTVLTMEDLGMAVGEYGINVRRGEFYR